MIFVQGVPGAHPVARALLLGSPSQTTGPDRQTLGQLSPRDATTSGRVSSPLINPRTNLFSVQDALKLVRRDRTVISTTSSSGDTMHPNFKDVGNGITMI